MNLLAELVVAGSVAGAKVGIAALGFTRLLTLYQVSARDPLSFGSASVIIVVASLLACFIPALRARHISPIGALKD